MIIIRLFYLCTIPASSATSLWGKKVQFSGSPCLWQLQSDAEVPALKELTVCTLLNFKLATDWTGFVYKAPGGRNIELGLGGKRTMLTAWILGEEHNLEIELKVGEWHSVCLTWSGRTQKLSIYFNGTLQQDFPVNPTLPQHLAPNGTLTLGVSHYVDPVGTVHPESATDLLGAIGLFRIWNREWSEEELRRQSCADGDVLSWETRQWKHDCLLQSDSSLQCGKHSITFLCFISWPSIQSFSN